MLLIKKPDFKAFAIKVGKNICKVSVSIIGCLIGNLKKENIIHCSSFSV